MWKGRWWYGFTSTVAPGHAASQQQPEASHAHFKRTLGDVAGKNLPAIVREIEACIKLWSSPPKHEEKSYTLLGHQSATRPQSPDAWMLTNLLHYVYEPGVATVTLPGIYRLVETTEKSPSCCVFRKTSSQRLYFMSFGNPCPISQETVDAMYAMLWKKNVEDLKALWLRLGVVEEEEGNLRFQTKRYRQFFGSHCVVFVSAGDGQASCTCWYFRRRGHCPHQYFVQLKEGTASFKPNPPLQKHAEAMDTNRKRKKRGSSASPEPPRSEPAPKKPRRPIAMHGPELPEAHLPPVSDSFGSRRRREELFEVPEQLRVYADVLPDPAPKAEPKVLPCQKIKKQC